MFSKTNPIYPAFLRQLVVVTTNSSLSRDAVIPFAEIGIGTNTIGLYYELNVSGIKAAGYSRNAFELSLRKSFKQKKKAVILKEE